MTFSFTNFCFFSSLNRHVATVHNKKSKSDSSNTVPVSNPDLEKKKAEGKDNKRSSTPKSIKNNGDIRKFFSLASTAGPSSKSNKAVETKTLMEDPDTKSSPNVVPQDLESLSKQQKQAHNVLISSDYSPKSSRENVLDNTDAESSPQAKRPRLSPPETVVTVDDSLVECPSCVKKFTQNAINKHLDVCLNQVKENDEEPQAGPSSIPPPGSVYCPICNNLVFENVINSHLDICLDSQ